MDAIMFEEERMFESSVELIKKACEKVNERLKNCNIITADNIWEHVTKEPEYDPLKVNKKEFCDGS